MHGFVSRDGEDPAEFRRVAAAQLRPYGVEVVRCEVESVARRAGSFELFLADGTSAAARRVVLATGVRDQLPPFEGFESIYGTSGHHCPHCDGWEWRGAKAAVYAPPAAAEYALAMAAWTPDVVLLTDGAPPPRGESARRLGRNGVRVETRRVGSLRSSGGRLRAVEFVGGGSLERDALFFHVGISHASPLPRAIGCAFERDGSVRVNGQFRTSVRGVYAVGDITPGPQSAISAAAAGAVAGAAVHHDLRSEEVL